MILNNLYYQLKKKEQNIHKKLQYNAISFVFKYINIPKFHCCARCHIFFLFFFIFIFYFLLLIQIRYNYLYYVNIFVIILLFIVHDIYLSSS
jgi:hypothetical protein